MKQIINIYKIKKIVNKILSQFNLQLVNRTWYKKLIPENGKFDDEGFSAEIDKKHFIDYFFYLNLSKSQFRQDLFVLSELGFKKKGFFIEFGATNGVDLSNTYLLETRFGWNGILSEPAKSWHSKLLSNRKAAVEKNCVWKSTGENILFNEVADKELSTINFELHESEETGLVFKILALAGVLIKDPNLYQISSTEQAKDVQEEKQ